MTDNVTITQGANSTPPNGTVIATDDVSGVQYQVVKLDQGANGLSSPVTDIATDGKLDDVIPFFRRKDNRTLHRMPKRTEPEPEKKRKKILGIF